MLHRYLKGFYALQRYCISFLFLILFFMGLLIQGFSSLYEIASSIFYFSSLLFLLSVLFYSKDLIPFVVGSFLALLLLFFHILSLSCAMQVFGVIGFGLALVIKLSNYFFYSIRRIEQLLDEKKENDMKRDLLEQEIIALSKREKIIYKEIKPDIGESHQIQKELSYLEAKYKQLSEQFLDQKNIIHALRKELFIVQGREISLSNKLKEHENNTLYTSLHEIACAFDTVLNEKEQRVIERRESEVLIQEYEKIIEKLMREKDYPRKSST